MKSDDPYKMQGPNFGNIEDQDNSFIDSQIEKVEYQIMSDERRHDHLSKSARIDQVFKAY